MKPYSGRLASKRTNSIALRGQSKAKSLPEYLLQFSTIAATLWSITAFMFGVGFVSRIDPSILQVLTLSDIFGLSLSYVVYLVPIAALIAIFPWQFMIPTPKNAIESSPYMDLIPFVFLRWIKGKKLVIIMVVGILPSVLLILADYYHWLDRSSMLSMMGDTLTLAFMMLSAFFLTPDRILVAPIGKPLLAALFSASIIFSGPYICGDYMASVRINNPRDLDCAIIVETGIRCIPILVWGSSYFITWKDNKMNAIPSNKVDRLWLHPNKRPSLRMKP